MRQRSEEDICDGCDDHKDGNAQALVSAAVGAVAYDDCEEKSDGVWGHCYSIGAHFVLVAKVLDDVWQENRISMPDRQLWSGRWLLACKASNRRWSCGYASIGWVRHCRSFIRTSVR